MKISKDIVRCEVGFEQKDSTIPLIIVNYTPSFQFFFFIACHYEQKKLKDKNIIDSTLKDHKNNEQRHCDQKKEKKKQIRWIHQHELVILNKSKWDTIKVSFKHIKQYLLWYVFLVCWINRIKEKHENMCSNTN